MIAELENILSVPGVARELRIDKATLTNKIVNHVIEPDFIDSHTARVFFRVTSLPRVRAIVKPATIPDLAA